MENGDVTSKRATINEVKDKRYERNAIQALMEKGMEGWHEWYRFMRAVPSVMYGMEVIAWNEMK